MQTTSFATISKMICARLCKNNGHTAREIAEAAGVSRSTVYRWLKASAHVCH